MMATYQCPDDNDPDVNGCGHVFTVANDQPWQDGNDDCVDCPACGIFWPFGDNVVATPVQ